MIFLLDGFLGNCFEVIVSKNPLTRKIFKCVKFQKFKQLIRPQFFVLELILKHENLGVPLF